LHFRPTPCGLPPFPAGPVGSPSFLPSPPGLTPAACLSASCPSPRSHQALRRHPRAHADAPLLGFHSPTALVNRGRPYLPAACSRRHHPSSGFPTLSTSFFALDPAMDLPASSRASFATAGAAGVDPRSSCSSLALRPGQGKSITGVLSKALSDPATSAFLRTLLSCASAPCNHSPFGRAAAWPSGRYRVSIAGPSALPR